MAGLVTPSMPVFVVEDLAAPSESGRSGTRAYCTLNEGLGKVLRYGAYGETLDMMQACAGPLSPAESAALYGGTAIHAYRIPAEPQPSP